MVNEHYSSQFNTEMILHIFAIHSVIKYDEQLKDQIKNIHLLTRTQKHPRTAH